MANPYAADTPHWEAALEFYYLDDVASAFQEVEEHGIGEGAELLRWYRVIEAEAITRAKSSTKQIGSWLSIEFVPEQLMGLESEIVTRTLSACNEVAARLGWEHSVQTHLAILAEETDAPWAANPYGYCVSKENFEKICLPNYLLDDPVEFCQAVAHEYAHVISTNIAEEYAPRWVEEAISVLVERQFDRETWQLFCEVHETWLTDRQLESVLTEHTDDESRKEDVWRAYQQAGWIGRYLASRKGEASLGEFLHELANESPAKNIMRTLKGQDRTEGALWHVYGLSKKSLFAYCHSWLRNLKADQV